MAMEIRAERSRLVPVLSHMGVTAACMIQHMGAWGPAVFSDDTAVDIRDDCRGLLEDQVPDDEAARRVIESYRDLDDDEHRLGDARSRAGCACPGASSGRTWSIT